MRTGSLRFPIALTLLIVCLTTIIVFVLLLLSVAQAQTRSSETSRGTGFIIHPDGYIVTAAHVIGAHCSISVMTDRGAYLAQLLRVDEENDLALLKVTGTKLPTILLGQFRGVKRQQPVWTFGYPLGREMGYALTATGGRITAIQESGTTKSFITDAAVNPGNSGGPVVNDRGQVIGVMVAKLLTSSGRFTISESLNFAVPIDAADNLLEGLQDNLFHSPAGPPLRAEEIDTLVSPAVVMVVARPGPPGVRLDLRLSPKKDPAQEFFEVENLKGHVKSIVSETKNARGGIRRRDYIRAYDRMGRLLEETKYLFGKIESRKVNTYGPSGNLASEESHYRDIVRNCAEKDSLDSSRCPLVSRREVYDALGNKLETGFLNEDGQTDFKSHIGYDTLGNIVEEIKFDSQGNEESRLRYFFACYGGVVNVSIPATGFDKSQTTTHTYRFDIRGNQISNEFRGVWSHTRSNYYYDTSGQLEKWEEIDYHSSGSVRERKVYDTLSRLTENLYATEEGKVLQDDVNVVIIEGENPPPKKKKDRTIIEMDKDGRPTRIYTDAVTEKDSMIKFSYDVFGNPASMEMTESRSAKTSRNTFRYEYDALGNWVKRRAFEETDHGEKAVGETVRLIEYY